MGGRLGNPLAGLARAFGYVLMPKRVAKYWQEISLLQRLLERLEVDCVIDVGANRGQYHDQLRDAVGYRGRIVSVEPMSALATGLETRANREDPLWEIHACALGATTDRLVPWPRAIAVPAFFGLALFTIDLAFGSPLVIRSVLGPSPGYGARFYGIGNELEAVLVILLLMGRI